MKVIENRKFKSPVQLGEKIFLENYMRLIQFALNSPPKEGLDIEGMRERIKISEIIKEATTDKDGNKLNPKTVQFEDAHLELIKECVNTLRLTGLYPEILDFADYINNDVKDKDVVDKG